MRLRRAWITGAGGLIGNQLVALSPQFAPGWEVVAITRAVLDLADFAGVRARFEQDSPQLVLHCAAMSKSPACQENPALARKVNVEVTKQLAGLAAQIPFLLFSTDLVFDGRKGAAYVETDAVNPLSVYGETKVEAEQAVLQNPRHLVVRTSLNCGVSPTGDRGFNEELRRTWQAGRVPRLFIDEFRCPIAASVTAHAVWKMALGGSTGVFHVAGAERLSRYEIGGLLAARCPELAPRIEAGSIRDYVGAPRPADLALDCRKAEAALSMRLPGLCEWLRENPDQRV